RTAAERKAPDPVAVARSGRRGGAFLALPPFGGARPRYGRGRPPQRHRARRRQERRDREAEIRGDRAVVLRRREAPSLEGPLTHRSFEARVLTAREHLRMTSGAF